MSVRAETSTVEEDGPHIVLIAGRLFGYGETAASAMRDFRKQIAGASPAMQRSMHDRAVLTAIDPDHASEVAEMLCAEPITWLPSHPA